MKSFKIISKIVIFLVVIPLCGSIFNKHWITYTRVDFSVGEIKMIYAFNIITAYMFGSIVHIYFILKKRVDAYYTEIREREVREKELEKIATESQLSALRAQINPHFLFNTLNVIAQMIGTAADKAEKSIENLANIFRHTLVSSEREFISLGSEMEFVDSYLAIEQARLGERLSVKKMIDKSLLHISVPGLILQPIVENAVKHGISPKASGGNIELSIAQINGYIEISVFDSGVGMSNPDLRDIFQKGTGIRNVKERLVKLYGDEYTPIVESRKGEYTKVTIKIPLKKQ